MKIFANSCCDFFQSFFRRDNISVGDKCVIFSTPSTGFPVARDAKTSRSPNSLTCRRSLFLARRTCFCRAKFAQVAEHFARSPPRRIYRCDDACNRNRLAVAKFYPTVLRTSSDLPSQNKHWILRDWKKRNFTTFETHTNITC